MRLACSFRVFVTAAALVVPAIGNSQDPARVRDDQKISSIEGNFPGALDDQDFFGRALAWVGDLDGDGVGDVAVGASCDDDGGSCRGAVWVLFLNADGTVKSTQKISDTEGGFAGNLEDSDLFGASLASLGDMDGDGVCDLAVGAIGDDDGGDRRGAVWILFLNADGTVRAHQKISSTQGGFAGILDDVDFFGYSVVTVGDLDGDGAGDLAVGALLDDDEQTPGFGDVGAVWILFLNPDGTVRGSQKISATQGGFTGEVHGIGNFGFAVGALGDLDGDAVNDLAVGNPGDYPPGAVWILFLNPDGTVKSHQKINDVEGGFSGKLYPDEGFGTALGRIGDLDGDGIDELAVGAGGDEDGGGHLGAVWILFLDGDGTVRVQRKISATRGGFQGQLDPGDFFGRSVTSVGDLDNDGIGDLAVGAFMDDDGGMDRGAVWILFMGNSLRSDHKSRFTDPVRPGGTLEFPHDPGVPAPSLVLLGTRLRAAPRDPGSAWRPRLDPRSVFAIVPGPASLRLPDDPALAGRTVYAQRLTFDRAGSGGGARRFGEVLEIRID